MEYDLLIKGGTVIDPSQSLNAPLDIAIYMGRIEAVKEDISPDQAREVLDASGHIVTPGLVDLHVHVYRGVSHYGIDADTYCLASGATTVVDAGSSGADTFEGFRKYIASVSATRIFAFLNISSMGMVSPKIGELEDLRFADVERAIKTIERNRDVIQGVKVRLSRSVVGENGLEPLKLALQVAEAVKMPVMIHPGNTSNPLPEILALLRDRDILTHCFHGNRQGILDDEGHVLDAVRKAVRRGVILDVGHGRGSFSFDVADKALSQGVVPETISSDLHHYNVFGPVHSLAVTASKFLYLGMSLEETLAKVTTIPAKILGAEEQLGNLRHGSFADIAVFSLKEGNFTLEDTVGKKVVGKKVLEPAAVVKNGHIHYSMLRLTGRR